MTQTALRFVSATLLLWLAACAGSDDGAEGAHTGTGNPGSSGDAGAAAPGSGTLAAEAAGDPNLGTLFVFRTLVNAAGPTPEQDERCDNYFGLLAPLALVRTNALTFAFSVDPSTGFVTDERARYLGPGLVCFTASSMDGQIAEGYVYGELPGVGGIEGEGGCELAPQPGIVWGAPFLQCRFKMKPDSKIGFLGGWATSSTVSGSIFAFHLFWEPGISLASVAPPPFDATVGELPNDPDLYVFRSFDETVASQSPACDGETVVARSVTLSATQPDLNTGRVDPDEDPSKSALATLCLSAPATTPTGTIDHSASAVVTLRRGGQTVEVLANGHCEELPTPAHPSLRQRTCNLGVSSSTAPGFWGGMIATSGLTDGDSGDQADPHIWSVALLADPVDADSTGDAASEDGAAPDGSEDAGAELETCVVRKRLEGALVWLERAAMDGQGGTIVQLAGDFYILQYGLNTFEQTVAEAFKDTSVCVTGCFTFFGCAATGTEPRVIEELECICPCPNDATASLNLLLDGTVDRAIELIEQLLAEGPCR